MTPEMAQRFWTKVDKTKTCWLWQASVLDTGYGQFKAGWTTLAHQVAYADLVGPIPAGMQLDHLCRVRHCVNPAHLEAVTGRENNARSQSPTAINAVKTHCVHGHLFDERNTRTYWSRGSWRRACRNCGRLSSQAQRAAS